MKENNIKGLKDLYKKVSKVWVLRKLFSTKTTNPFFIGLLLFF
jgi:hypothetical protein